MQAAGGTAHSKQATAWFASQRPINGDVAPVGNAASFRTHSVAVQAPVAASPAGHAMTSLPLAVESAAQVGKSPQTARHASKNYAIAQLLASH